MSHKSSAPLSTQFSTVITNRGLIGLTSVVAECSRFLRFGAVGLGGAVINYVSLNVFTGLGLSLLVASYLSVIVSSVVVFFFNARWVFSAAGWRFFRSLRFGILYFISGNLFVLIIELCHQHLGRLEWAFLFAVAFQSIFNYMGLRFYVFSN